jgi:hypothetical protein
MFNKNVRVVIYCNGKIHDIYEGDKERSQTLNSNNQSLFAGLKLLISPTDQRFSKPSEITDIKNITNKEGVIFRLGFLPAVAGHGVALPLIGHRSSVNYNRLQADKSVS